MRNEAINFIIDWAKSNPGKTIVVDKSNFSSRDAFGQDMKEKLNAAHLYGFRPSEVKTSSLLSNGSTLLYRANRSNEVAADMTVFIYTTADADARRKLIDDVGEKGRLFIAE